MFYQSSRSDDLTATSAKSILEGIAPDGGLYSVKDLDGVGFDWKAVLKMDTRSMAVKILSALLPSFSEEEMRAIVEAGYHEKFDTEELTPTVSVGEDTILELFRGPTSAFKDVALSLLPRLMVASGHKCGSTDEILILTATSGDTGKAAMEGFRDVPGTRILVFYPYGSVSQVQELQMTTQEGKNVLACAVKGNFDDAQRGVKNIFGNALIAEELKKNAIRLTSANSINIGRLAPQVVYYFKAYADLIQKGTILLGEKVDFCVPTGNFGDILAGYFAKELGLPVGKLICASNANNVLTDFLSTGRFDSRREFFRTESPSMDILVPSNLERMLFMLCKDAAQVSNMMASLKSDGVYEVPEQIFNRLTDIFWPGCCGDEGTEQSIGEVWKQFGYLMDTHTAVAWNVAQQYKKANPDHAPVVILSTASPYKFPEAVLRAIGESKGKDPFDDMEKLKEVTGTAVPKNLSGLRERPVRHHDVIECKDMADYVVKMALKKAW